MKLNRKILLFFSAFVLFLKALPAKAVCPVCIVAVSTGVGLCRYLGIDDSISGVWIGGLLVAIFVWTIDYLNRKNIRFKGRKILIFLAYYLLTIVPLYWKGIIGHPFNKFWGIDKLLLGIIFGTLIFPLAVFFNNYLKKKNGGKTYFPFQKVVIPIIALGILSGLFYSLTC